MQPYQDKKIRRRALRLLVTCI